MCKVRPLQLGSLESIREIPGFLTAIMTGTLVALAESRVAGAGVAHRRHWCWPTGQMPTFAPLVAITVFWSIGFHLYASMAPVITLTLAKGQEGGRHLGRMGAVGSVATLAGLGTAWLMRWLMPSLPYNGYSFWPGLAFSFGTALHGAGQT
jgi:hypothetical protein